MQYAIIGIIIVLAVGYFLVADKGTENTGTDDQVATETAEQNGQPEEQINEEHNQTEKNMEEQTQGPVDTSGLEYTDSGLGYKVLQEGDGGNKPTIASTVEVHYHGTLASGEVFDSSVLRGETIKFPLSNLIAGWQEGIPLMSVGDKYLFEVPAELAYGPAGSGHSLAGQTLYFEVELFSFE